MKRRELPQATDMRPGYSPFGPAGEGVQPEITSVALPYVRRHPIPHPRPSVEPMTGHFQVVDRSTQPADPDTQAEDLYPNLTVKLSSNPTIDEVAERLRTSTPDWDALFTAASSIRTRDVCLGSVRGRLGELHVRAVLQELAADPAMQGAIRLDPINRDAQTRDYFFRPQPSGNVVVYPRNGDESFKAGHAQAVTDWDFVVDAEGQKVFGEVKITNNRKQGTSNGKTKGYVGALKEGKINTSLAAAQAYYNDREGLGEYSYIVVAPPDVVHLEEERERQFTRVGGIVLSLEEIPFGSIDRAAKKWMDDNGLSYYENGRH